MMPGKRKPARKKTCGQCIHEWACAAWNVGNLHNTDASSCINYETVKESTAYYIGYQDGKKATKKTGGAV